MVRGGKVEVTKSVLRANWAEEGAVIRVRERGSVRVEGCVISANVAAKSGGVM
jgi:hypothetical protein